MKIRTFLLLLALRMLGGRWFPVQGRSVLILRASGFSESAVLRATEIVGPLGMRVLALPAYVEVEGVVAEWSA